MKYFIIIPWQKKIYFIKMIEFILKQQRMSDTCNSCIIGTQVGEAVCKPCEGRVN